MNSNITQYKLIKLQNETTNFCKKVKYQLKYINYLLSHATAPKSRKDLYSMKLL